MHVLAFLTLKAFMPIYSPPPYILLLLLSFSRLHITPPPPATNYLCCSKAGSVWSLLAQLSPAEKGEGEGRESCTCCRVKSMWKLYCKIINQAELQSAACPSISHYSLELQTQGHACTSHCSFGAVKSRRRGPQGRSCPRREGCDGAGEPRWDPFGLCGEDTITLAVTNL